MTVKLSKQYASKKKFYFSAWNILKYLLMFKCFINQKYLCYFAFFKQEI